MMFYVETFFITTQYLSYYICVETSILENLLGGLIMAVLNLKGNANAVEAIVNAVVAGYRDDLILEELAQAIEDEVITREQFRSAIEGLKLYVARFADSIKDVTNSMSQFEFNERRSIIKNRPLNLAQQVMQDVEGFEQAANEFYGDEEQEIEADIKKPNNPIAPKQDIKKDDEKVVVGSK